MGMLAIWQPLPKFAFPGQGGAARRVSSAL
jgi:hypothetical protein